MNAKIAIILGALGSAMLATLQTSKTVDVKPYFEYQIVRKDASGSGYSRMGRQYSSVGAEATWTQPDKAEMDLMGAQGWELVSSYLEMETSFPNFARGDTVEGLKSNVRPQAVVFVFKRAISAEQAGNKRTAARRAAEAELAAEKAKAEVAKLTKAERDAKRPEAQKANLALWEQHKKEAVLDGVVPKSEDDSTLAILATGPDSRFDAGGHILGIQTDLENEEYITVSSWEQVRKLTADYAGKKVRVQWRSLEGQTYGTVITLPPNP